MATTIMLVLRIELEEEPDDPRLRNLETHIRTTLQDSLYRFQSGRSDPYSYVLSNYVERMKLYKEGSPEFDDKVRQVHLRTEIASKLHESTFSDRTFEYTIGKK